jgi:hypothetical protein
MFYELPKLAVGLRGRKELGGRQYIGGWEEEKRKERAIRVIAFTDNSDLDNGR